MDLKGEDYMRVLLALACGFLVSCTSVPVGVPTDTPPIITEVTPPPVAATSTSGGDLAANGTASLAGVAPATTPLDADNLNLNLYSLEQQKIDAAAAERDLADARSQLVIIQPGRLPDRVEGVNIALYAQQTTNLVGQRIYSRSRSFGSSGCGRFSSADQAQRVFLAAGGPQNDQYNLDSDGDGFACGWDPAPYRALKI